MMRVGRMRYYCMRWVNMRKLSSILRFKFEKAVSLVKDKHHEMIFEESERIEKEDLKQVDFNRRFVQMIKQREDK